MDGLFSLPMAMIVPGMFLSQPGRDTFASYHCAPHRGLNAVGYQVSGLKTVAHAVCAHGDCIAHPDSVKSAVTPKSMSPFYCVSH